MKPHSNNTHSITSENIELNLDNVRTVNPEQLSYEEMRQPLWAIHEFVQEVLAKDAPGFRITTKKNGSKMVEPLALGRRHYKLMNNYVARIPLPCKPAGLIGLFLDCCIELKLFFNPFGKPIDLHRPGMNGAELFNALLELIRKRAQTDKRCKKLLNLSTDYDLVEMKSIVRYINALFVNYSKILVVRVDLGYAADEAEKITFERASRDINRFVNNRHWHACFKHCIGFVIAREKGTGSAQENGGTGRGYHFHCFVLFDGQIEKNDVELSKQVIDYWENRIVNSPRTPDSDRIQVWKHNCNLYKDKYEYCGIGMIPHSDELKRSHMLYAILYITKESQPLGEAASARSKSMSKGNLKPPKVEYRGRQRQLMINGQRVQVPRQAMRAGDFLQLRDMV